MGMFDNIKCLYPLPTSELLDKVKFSYKTEWFQTKSLDNLMNGYIITEDGRLVEEVIEREYIVYTDEEYAALPHPKPWSKFKDIVIKSKTQVDVPYHGKVLFYTSGEFDAKNDVWIEFCAYFVYGKLDKIEVFDVHLTTSSEVINLEWEQKRAIEAQKPWNRFKESLRVFGWFKFWRITSRWIGKVSILLQRIEYAIVKHML